MQDLPIVEFESGAALRRWLASNHATSSGIRLRIFKKNSGIGSVSFQEVLEAGLSYGWSESKREGLDELSYLQRFTPRRVPGTASQRNRQIAERLIAEGRMTSAGRAALGIDPT